MNPIRGIQWPTLAQGVLRLRMHAGLVLLSAAVTGVVSAATPVAFVNSLGQRFAPLPGSDALLCVWETRVSDFRAFVDDTHYDATGPMFTLGDDDYDWRPTGHTWRDPGFAQHPDHPVVGVNLADATAFCHWLTKREQASGQIAQDRAYRLPNDREWSAAMQAGDEPQATPEERMAAASVVYPWGPDWPPPAEFGNYAGTESAAGKPTWWGTIPGGYTDRHPRTSPVGSFAPNALGFFDLSGNVWEWVDEAYTTSSIAKITRGGCWGSDRPAYLLKSKRVPTFVGSRNDEIGFRIVLAPQ